MVIATLAAGNQYHGMGSCILDMIFLDRTVDFAISCAGKLPPTPKHFTTTIVMAGTSEKSFADRLGRARSMHSFIDGFTPAFAPQDPNIAPSAFESYCNGCEGANNDVSEAESVLTTVTGERSDAAAALQAKAGQVQDYVEANVAWKKYHKSIIDASRAVRGISTPARKAPAPAPGTPPPPVKPARSGAKSQQGYADLSKHFAKLIKAVAKITGYAAAVGSGLQITELTAQETAYNALNSAVLDAEATLDEAQTTRTNFYDGEGGLKEKMKAIKKAVAGQYGRGSDQAAAVKGIAL